MCNAGADFVKSLCEIALNVLSGNIPLTDKQYKLLKKKKKLIRLVASKKGSLTSKKKKLNQTGGFLFSLLGAAIPFIINLIRGGQ